MHAEVAAGQLGSMIDDLLFLARIDRDPLAVQPTQTVTIQELVSGWDLGYRSLTSKKEIQFTTHVDDNLPSLQIDERKFQQAVGNIIDNAVKFTPRTGRIELRAECRDDCISIVVDDSGPGIPLNQREKVFERFYQANEGSGRSDGLGLGLAIAARVAVAHGGRVAAEESPLGGARFVLMFPVTTIG